MKMMRFTKLYDNTEWQIRSIFPIKLQIDKCEAQRLQASLQSSLQPNIKVESKLIVIVH